MFESIGGDFVARDIQVAGPFARIVVFGMASGGTSNPEVGALFQNPVSVSGFWMFTLAYHP